ncbi:hypothetical protein SLS55_005493 [Diplodia seriata]|uniref:Uncharacterized protein n=1 Tax=Diplodia seriata TaxID=420778 RepID=A0ABR3CGJ6_9PEZI
MILEVNNTFGERRMYLLKGSSHDVHDSSDDTDTTGHTKQPTKFTDAWTKDFHVSPFNSRKGSYSLTAIDPFHMAQGVSHIDNNIVLRSHLESFFRRYLRYLVSHTDQPIRVSYTPAPGLGETEEILSSSAKEDQSSNSLDINVTSPAFYSRFVHYYHTSEALDRESLFTDEKNKTAWISNPQALKLLPLNHPRYVEPLPFKLTQLGVTNVVQGSSPAFAREDIRPKGFATCDEYVMRNCHDARVYRQCLLKLFLAQRFGLGFTEVIDLFDLIVRICLTVGIWNVVSRDLRALGAEDAGSAVPKILGLNAVHAWSLIKGAL